MLFCYVQCYKLSVCVYMELTYPQNCSLIVQQSCSKRTTKMFNGSILLPSTVTFSLNHHDLCVVLNVFRLHKWSTLSCDWIFIIKHVKHISRETLEKSKLLRNYAFLAFSSIIMSYLVPISNFKRKCVLYSYTLVEILTRYLFLQIRFYHQGILFWNQSFNECWFDNAYSTSKAISKWNKKKRTYFSLKF